MSTIKVHCHHCCKTTIWKIVILPSFNEVFECQECGATSTEHVENNSCGNCGELAIGCLDNGLCPTCAKNAIA